jgi:hypothetical protein
MTPKEKAEEMYRTYIDYTHGHFNCKQCVRIAVDEIILANPHSNTFTNVEYSTMDYWKEVKKEIEKL